MTPEELRRELKLLAEPALEDFQKKIVSDTRYPMLCARVPKLRVLAKKAAKGEWLQLVENCRCEYYEEVLVLGLTVAYAKADLADKFDLLWNFILPQLDSWALTDSIVPTLKIPEPELPLAWDFAMRCLDAQGEYIRRFGIVMLMDYFLRPEYLPAVSGIMRKLQDERYYVRMAAAWLLAEMAVYDCDEVFAILQSVQLDTFVHNMTIRKMRESYRITAEQKAYAATLRRKDTI